MSSITNRCTRSREPGGLTIDARSRGPLIIGVLDMIKVGYQAEGYLHSAGEHPTAWLRLFSDGRENIRRQARISRWLDANR